MIAVASTSTSSIEITCPVCFDAYDDENCVPLFIPSKCGHSMCSNCMPMVMRNPDSRCVVCQKRRIRDGPMEWKNQNLINSLQNLKRMKEKIAEVEAENDELLQMCTNFGAPPAREGEEGEGGEERGEEREEVSDAQVEADEDQWLCRKKNGPIEAGLRKIAKLENRKSLKMKRRGWYFDKIENLEKKKDREFPPTFFEKHIWKIKCVILGLASFFIILLSGLLTSVENRSVKQ